MVNDKIEMKTKVRVGTGLTVRVLEITSYKKDKELIINGIPKSILSKILTGDSDLLVDEKRIYTFNPFKVKPDRTPENYMEKYMGGGNIFGDDLEIPEILRFGVDGPILRHIIGEPKDIKTISPASQEIRKLEKIVSEQSEEGITEIDFLINSLQKKIKESGIEPTSYLQIIDQLEKNIQYLKQQHEEEMEQMSEQYRVAEVEHEELLKKQAERITQQEEKLKVYQQLPTIEVEEVEGTGAKEEISIDNRKILGAVACTIDKLFFSGMVTDFKREKMGEFENDCRKRLEKEVKTSIQWDLTDQFEEYERIKREFIKERLPARIEIKAEILTQDFYDLYMEKEIKKGNTVTLIDNMKLNIVTLIDNMKSGQNYKEFLEAQRDILVEYFCPFYNYVLNQNPNLSKASLRDSTIINHFLFRIYEIMKIKDNLSYSTTAEEHYNSITKRRTRPILGKELNTDDIKEIIKLANTTLPDGFDTLP